MFLWKISSREIITNLNDCIFKVMSSKKLCIERMYPERKARRSFISHSRSLPVSLHRGVCRDPREFTIYKYRTMCRAWHANRL